MGLSLRGQTSGAIDINAPNVAGDNTITLPGTNGAANQFYKNSGTAGIVTHSSMVEDSSGSVGIGTDNPTSILDINSGANGRVRIVDSASATLELERTGAKSYLIQSVINSGLRVYDEDAVAERIRIDINGNLGIANNNPSDFKSGAENLVVGSGSGAEGITIYSENNASGRICFADGSGASDEERGVIQYAHDDNHMQFNTDATERMRIDSAGRLLIGTTTDSGSQLLQMIGGSSATADVFIGNSVASTGQTAKITMAPANSIAGAQLICTAEEDFSTGANRTARLAFATRRDGNLDERMRITPTGRLLLGTTTESAITAAQQVIQTNGIGNLLLYNTGSGGWNCINSSVANGGTYYYHGFLNGAALIGSITSTNGTTVTYAQNSDYRLKENVVDIVDGITRLKQLQPRRFNFIVDPDTTFDGFLAHETQTVVPEAITGTKDEVDDDGNAVMQGIDQSKLVPLLTAALQEAIAKIETLETQNADLLSRVTALEG